MTVRISEDAFFQEVKGEAVVLDVKTGTYYGLDQVGARMWQLLAEHSSMGTIVPILLEEYDVTEDQLRADLSAFLDRLQAKGLLCVEDAASGAVADASLV